MKYNHYLQLKKRLEYLEEKIESLETVPSYDFSKMIVDGSHKNKNIQELIVELKDEYEKMKKEVIEECIKIERLIYENEDEELRNILSLKFISGLTWREIGERLNYDRTTVFKKYKKWMDEFGN